MKRRGYIYITIGIILFLFVIYSNRNNGLRTNTFSSYSILQSSWEDYKSRFINSDGRVIDHSRSDITTSEGQSYAMLRAVWTDDKPTFDNVWKWTVQNLKRKNDNLLGWQWGKRGDGSFGYMPDGGSNFASDADSDTALALIFASRRWNDTSYQTAAVKILNDIWNESTVVVGGNRYLLPGSWAQNNSSVILNPSYFAPYAWRIFGQADPRHNWTALIDPAYSLLRESGTARLDTQKAVGLPPDWLMISRQTGVLSAANVAGLTTNYSYDAMRIPWRIALDYAWNKDAKAAGYLRSSFKYLAEQYRQNGRLASSYSHDGKPLTGYENPAMYATMLGYFIVSDPQAARQIYSQKIIKLYSNDQNTFKKELPYYEQNWLWFGAALFDKQLISY